MWLLLTLGLVTPILAGLLAFRTLRAASTDGDSPNFGL